MGGYLLLAETEVPIIFHGAVQNWKEKQGYISLTTD